MKNIILAFIFCMLLNVSCDKNEFLDKKPIKALLVPTTLSDFEKLLDNPDMNITGELGEISSDDYYLASSAAWNTLNNNYSRNGYVWETEIFESGDNSPDWNVLYKQVLYSNIVLEGLEDYNSHLKGTENYNRIKGWALFLRGFAYFNLAQNFTLPFDKVTAKDKLGLPIRKSSNVSEIIQRSDLQTTYNYILNDLNESLNLLPNKRPGVDLNRPYKITANAALSRIYLSMREYDLAYLYANEALNIHDKLMDFNSLNLTTNIPINLINDETLYSASFTVISSELLQTFRTGPNILVDSLLYKSYDNNDLRKYILFGTSPTTGKNGYKASYHGNTKPFNGLATDELYFTKAECLVRNGDIEEGLKVLNSILIKRWKTGTYIKHSNLGRNESLKLILQERRKGMPFRGVRWLDLRRLNIEGFNIELKRNIDGKIYILEPNSVKYAIPIPPKEIQLSGIDQNIR